MASSTTKPTEMVSAISEILSRLKLRRYIDPNDPSSASGTVTPGITVAQTLRRNNRMTMITSTIVKPSVNSTRSEEHTSELQSLTNLVCRLLLEKKKKKKKNKKKKIRKMK